jgi:hypothetical protein
LECQTYGDEMGGGILAQECLETARTIANEDARDALLQMAQVWQRLAEQKERTAQQQQVQPKDKHKKE